MYIDQDKCVGCCACQQACPMQAITYINNKCQIDASKCINCGTCAMQCPMQAITA